MLSVLQLKQKAGWIKENIQKKKVKGNKRKYFKTNSISTCPYNSRFYTFLCLKLCVDLRHSF